MTRSEEDKHDVRSTKCIYKRMEGSSQKSQLTYLNFLYVLKARVCNVVNWNSEEVPL